MNEPDKRRFSHLIELPPGTALRRLDEDDYELYWELDGRGVYRRNAEDLWRMFGLHIDRVIAYYPLNLQHLWHNKSSSSPGSSASACRRGGGSTS